MKSKTLNNIFFFLGLAAIVGMVLTFDVSFAELWQHICHAGYWLVAIVGVWLLIYGINAMAWMSIIRGGNNGKVDVSFWRIYRLTITGYALNYATPVGALGGEPYRILELTKDIGKERATSSVISYAMMHIYSHFWFWLISIFLYLALAADGNVPLPASMVILLSCVMAFCFLAFYVFYKGYQNGVVVKLISWLGKIPGLKGWSIRFKENNAQTLQKIDEQIAALHAQDKRAFYTSLVLEYFSRVVQSSEVFFMLLLFDVTYGGGFSGYTMVYLHSILIVAFTSFFANMVGLLPLQLGVQEGSFIASIAGLGLTAAIGVFVGIICRVREIIWIFIGLLLMKVGKDTRT